MNRSKVLAGLYDFLQKSFPSTSINLIIDHDIRVENFFAVHTAVYLNSLEKKGEIKDFKLQHPVLNGPRAHIDIMIVDSKNNKTYLEIKHFSISKKRKSARDLRFYTNDTTSGKKVGIIGDCEKLDLLSKAGRIEKKTELICCAFITHRPTIDNFKVMNTRLEDCMKPNGWKIICPIPFDKQRENLGIIALQKIT